MAGPAPLPDIVVQKKGQVGSSPIRYNCELSTGANHSQGVWGGGTCLPKTVGKILVPEHSRRIASFHIQKSVGVGSSWMKMCRDELSELSEMTNSSKVAPSHFNISKRWRRFQNLLTVLREIRSLQQYPT
jgi:hypothetical protein